MYVLGWIGLAVLVYVLVHLAWRYASRQWQLPCPAFLAGTLEWGLTDRVAGTQVTLERMGVAAGQHLLEIGPGPGRLLIPAAKRVGPGGTATGLDIQPRMIQRLLERARAAGVGNLTTVIGDATQPHFPPESFDLVFLCTVLGEIPDRDAALRQVYTVLKPGGKLAVTELLGDPHYQSRATVRRLAEAAGLQFESTAGSWLRFTSNFRRPSAAAPSARVAGGATP